MKFHAGDHVFHLTYGLGEIIRLEERTLAGKTELYYVVQVRDLTVWVPASEEAEGRLRKPTSGLELKKMLDRLGDSSHPLPDNRYERKTQLSEMLKDGKVESIYQVICALTAYGLKKPLNDNDKEILKRALDMLAGEYGYSFSIPSAQAASELQQILTKFSPGLLS